MDDDGEVIGTTNVSVSDLADQAGEDGAWFFIDHEGETAGKFNVIVTYDKPPEAPETTALPPSQPYAAAAPAP